MINKAVKSEVEDAPVIPIFCTSTRQYIRADKMIRILLKSTELAQVQRQQLRAWEKMNHKFLSFWIGGNHVTKLLVIPTFNLLSLS